MSYSEPFKVVIAGAGVAGLEAAFALHELAGDAVEVTLLAPSERFSYRPLAVYEPFSSAPTPSYEVSELARAAGARRVTESFKWLDRDAQLVHTSGGGELGYDALLLALGARRHAQFPFVTTLNPATLGVQLQKLVYEVEHGVARRVSFVIPAGHTWPLPIYELALMLAARAGQAGADVAITIVASEPTPLAVFGEQASTEVARLLDESGVTFLGGSPAQVHTPHWISRRGTATRLYADRIVALPELSAPDLPGVPTQARGGFVSIDRGGQVIGLERVFAAGDLTASAVKHGGLAAQQADTAAAQIATLAGALEGAEPGVEIAHAVLLGGTAPLYIRAYMIGGVTTRSEASDKPFWESSEKLHARYLGPALAAAVDHRERHPAPRVA